ncbi:hypothetical protein [Arthrobacter sp. N199823]|uniref:hypothetical protein n=1 Tax=Arthrobacter sp. N199823 TaxID=2058895 RepID=UPI0011B02D4C|nr:hypothetical protein [Arthrobacter sp. N199823]
MPIRLTMTAEQAPGVRRRGRSGVTFLALLSLLVMLLAAGCAKTQEPEVPAVDLQIAKSTTMANERDMISVIATGDIVETNQNEVSNLLACSDGEYSWTGQINVFLMPGADGLGYVQKIKDAWSGKGDWNVAERTTAQGETVVDITNDAGYSHGVDFSAGHNTIRVMSFSPCFTMDPPYEYGNEY